MSPSTGPDLTRRLRRGRLIPSRLPLAVLANPFQFVTAALSVVLGVGVVVTLIDHLVPFTRVQVDLPTPLAMAWGGLMVIGGGLTVVAILRHDWNPARYEALECAALVVLAAAWFVFAAAPFFNAGAYSATTIGILVSTACALRITAIIVAQRVGEEARALQREVRK